MRICQSFTSSFISLNTSHIINTPEVFTPKGQRVVKNMDPVGPTDATSNAPIWPITRKDLTEDQRVCCDDIITAFRLATIPVRDTPTTDAAGNRPSKEFTQFTFDETREHLWDGVFGFPEEGGETWDTSKSVGLMPEYNSPPPCMRLVIGEFTRDLPPSSNTKRLAPNKPVKEDRRQGAPAVMYPRMTKGKEDTIEWFYCDMRGKGASPKFINVTAHGSLANRAMVLVEVDADNWLAVREFNEEYAMFLMKQRLLRVAIAQQPPKLMVQRWPDPTAADFADFKTHRSMPMVVLRQPSTGERAQLQEEILARRKQIPYSIDFCPPEPAS